MTSVSISQGKLKGAKLATIDGFEYYEFIGVPYAKPPVGDLRFKSPQLPESWKGERDATTLYPDQIASQYLFIKDEPLIGTEDCLYLNVYTPTLHSKDLLPVMVFIHGGGFMIGTGLDKNEAGPDYLITHNVVVVTINYRLSVLGFLNLGIREAAGNMGLKDQVRALEWVHKNIKTFCGDKNNVTIFGPSAGAASVEYLCLSPLGQGLFHKAVIESGSTLNHWTINFNPKPLIDRLLERLNYEGSFDDMKDIHVFLNKVSARELVNEAHFATEELSPHKIFFGFVPSIENNFGKGDEFLTVHPYKLLKNGQINKVPMIRGFCASEGTVAFALKPDTIKALTRSKNFIAHWPYELKAKYNDRLSVAYSGQSKISDVSDQYAVDFFGDLDFSAGVWVASKLLAKRGLTIYQYIFSYDGNGNQFKRLFNLKRKGAAHCDESGFLLKMSLVGGLDEDDLLIKKRLTKMWTDFAKTGNPTPCTSNIIPLNWTKFSEDAQSYLNINKDLTTEQMYEPTKIALFEEIYAKFEK